MEELYREEQIKQNELNKQELRKATMEEHREDNKRAERDEQSRELLMEHVPNIKRVASPGPPAWSNL